ncbi:MAG: BrnT family toxin [Betaproteobacteria bacterium]|nr:BrnT family toxin [Betaproteobacteria bacterium]
MKTKFVWDPVKAESNFRKRRVRFETARNVFFDPFALVEEVCIENGEQRWQTLGIADDYLLLLVAHTVRNDEDGTETIRIISARRAEPKERKRYEQGRCL